VSAGWVTLTAEKLKDEFRTDVNPMELCRLLGAVVGASQILVEACWPSP
jgi:electron transfer flavoprotein alpha subunit